ncbi:HNH endonuclease signature motif containing protein [Amycolatopsis sp.]|uniref:HNH endonuclease signature motif containing protein n=1 Tax=Amycolatopsis sp. TaxID=37632 RepID=UPI0039C89126
MRRKRTGIWELSGRFDDETGTRAHALLDALAERRTGDEGPDFRTTPQRYGDAFSDAVDLALNSPELPMQAGERAHVMVAVSLNDLKSGVGKAPLGDTGTMTAAEARVHACDAMIIPAVLGANSEPLNLGRLRRLISAGLRRALFLRDRGCAFPGCHRPPRHCQGHHVRHWADGGPTNLHNLVLMCAHHHRLLHRSGWEVRIAPDGLPEFLPPTFIGQRRQPRRNNLHQPLPFAA